MLGWLRKPILILTNERRKMWPVLQECTNYKKNYTIDFLILGLIKK